MKTRFFLESPKEVDFIVLAINSHAKGYKLCWNINRKLQTSFAKQEDHNVEKKMWFARYTYICEEGNEYNLLANRSKQGYLVPNQKSINYFLIVKKGVVEEKKKELISKLNTIKDILLVFEIKTSVIKKIERLILNEKKN